MVKYRLMFGQHCFFKRSEPRGTMSLVEKVLRILEDLSQSWMPITQKVFFLCMIEEVSLPWFVFYRVTHVGAHMFDVNTFLQNLCCYLV